MLSGLTLTLKMKSEFLYFKHYSIDFQSSKGMDLNSPVTDDYFDKAPFEFEGTIKKLFFKYFEE